MERKVYEILYNDEKDHWELKRQGADKPTRTFDNKEDTYQYGRGLCDENRPSELIIHNMDGEVEDKSMYNGTS
ncbi:DUF2188 domain-containing protein [Pseudalkalibacillus caeni]|uniref:DUF2188 domain-containing protein n=1 Tax=Exobacillus caeni TaxID=2574798 RepID=A0A5R9F6E1_9BACL|nr:DUF2188 domain-containing protein [Pseudalkalibacillus caeni]TLS37916.1 DUF2188 domain-containing protein [Pseudalkalibacillus caeni]